MKGSLVRLKEDQWAVQVLVREDEMLFCALTDLLI